MSAQLRATPELGRSTVDALRRGASRARFAERIGVQMTPFGLLSPFEQQKEILELLRLLEPHKASDCRKIRVGNVGDGGYVQLDDFKNVTRAFSFGIADNDQWDLAIAKRGVRVEQFDPSIESAPSSHALLRFHRKKVASVAAEGTVTLESLVEQYTTSKGPELLLNCDIEGSEWDVFDSTPSSALSKFTQIICEFHGMRSLSDPGFFPKAKRVFTKIHEHFAVVHVHANNFAPLVISHGIAVPQVIEITFAHRKRYTLGKSREKFPGPLDSPNDLRIPDLHLGLFQF